MELKKISKVPIFDIISSTIDYVNSLNYKKIGVIGTTRTIQSQIFKNNLQCEVLELATKEFVEMIEENKVNTNIIKNYLTKLGSIDALILGCTHYPSLINEFKKYLDKKIEIIDMGEVLSNKLKLENKGEYNLTLYFTKVSESLLNNIKKIIKEDYKIIEVEVNNESNY